MAERKVRVLLAEDDASLAYVISDNLSDAGYDVVICKDGQAAIERFDKNKFDICLLDIMMPHQDGFTVAKKIRQQSDLIPILFLTAKSLEEDRIKGFKTGADDYIVKPFSMQELLLRMEVFLRRSRKIESKAQSSYQIGELMFHPGALRLDTPAGGVTVTQKEADLLVFLCQNPNILLKRDEILLNVWGKDDYFLGRSMDVFMTKMRKLLRPDAAINLETIHGLGFRFNAAVKEV
jgi:DNA-binding response OmpR family regulator